jgi:predicted permease
MNLLASIRSFVRTVFHRADVNIEKDEELRSHIQCRADDLECSGLPRAEAERQARVELGGYERYKEECHEAAGGNLLGMFTQDVKFAIRSFARDRVTTAAALVVLAAGIGVNVALFSVINAVLLRSLPFRDPQSLLFLHETNLHVPRFGLSYPDFKDWQEQNKSFEAMAGYSSSGHENSVLAYKGELSQISGVSVSSNFFSMLGVHPEYGRDFTSLDEHAGTDQVVMLSHRLWQEHFASNPGVVGQSVEINGVAFTIAGVISQQTQFPKDADLWIPISQMSKADQARRQARRVWVIGRLKKGISAGQAQKDLEFIANRLAATYPADDKDVGVGMTTLLDYFTGGVKVLLMVLLGASTIVMVIACSNFAHLLLGRAARRKKEIALRVALGATRQRIFRQLLTESLVLATIGTIGGLIIGFIGTILLRRWAADFSTIARLDETRIDLTVLLYSIGVSLVTGTLFGTLPATQTLRNDLATSLKKPTTSQNPRRPWSMRNLLIIGEIAITVTVVISTGLLVKSLNRLTKVDPGFRVDRILTVQLALPYQKYSSYGMTKAFYQDLLQRVKAVPAVREASTINILPIMPSMGLMFFGVEGQAPRSLTEYPVAQIRSVSPGYFESMNIPLLEGRSFQPSDLMQGAQEGYVINDRLAKLYFGNQYPIGKKILVAEAPTPYTVSVIGVVADVKDIGLDKSADPEIYAVGFQAKSALMIRTELDDPFSLVPTIRNIVRSIDSGQPIGDARTMSSIIDTSLSQQKLLASLMGLFSTLAIILSAVGLFGVVSYSVGQQVAALAVRMALGAARADIVRLVLIQEMKQVILGLTLGIVGAWSLRKIISGLVYSISITDGWTYALSCLFVVLTAFVAMAVPLRRAVSIEPQQALREG